MVFSELGHSHFPFTMIVSNFGADNFDEIGLIPSPYC